MLLCVGSTYLWLGTSLGRKIASHAPRCWWGLLDVSCRNNRIGTLMATEGPV